MNVILRPNHQWWLLALLARVQDLRAGEISARKLSNVSGRIIQTMTFMNTLTIAPELLRLGAISVAVSDSPFAEKYVS